jgi:hypothetical protein
VIERFFKEAIILLKIFLEVAIMWFEISFQNMLEGNIPKYSVHWPYIVSLYEEANQNIFDEATAHQYQLHGNT